MTLVIAAGGTGGHLYPAVALAREFLRTDPGAAIVFVGTERGIEAKVLLHERLELQTITALPVMGVGWRRSALGLLALPRGIMQAASILRQRRADLVIGIGGYTTPPVLLAAALLRIPRVILEPNAYPGMANRFLAPLAHRIYVAFEAAARHFDSARVEVVGTPIRRAFIEQREPQGAKAGQGPTLLVFGGSQGARAINTAMVEALPRLAAALPRLDIIHQTGEAGYQAVIEAYRAAGVSAEVSPFLFDMPSALARADLVVARAGAVTVAELTACGKPAILVPLPQAIYGHQERNARVLEAAGAAEVLLQSELTGASLAARVVALLQDPDRLARMARAGRQLGRLDAADRIVEDCRRLLTNRINQRGR